MPTRMLPAAYTPRQAGPMCHYEGSVSICRWSSPMLSTWRLLGKAGFTEGKTFLRSFVKGIVVDGKKAIVHNRGGYDAALQNLRRANLRATWVVLRIAFMRAVCRRIYPPTNFPGGCLLAELYEVKQPSQKASGAASHYRCSPLAVRRTAHFPRSLVPG